MRIPRVNLIPGQSLNCGKQTLTTISGYLNIFITKNLMIFYLYSYSTNNYKKYAIYFINKSTYNKIS